MYPIYRDLRDKLGEPLWHDGHGVPRYAEFHPSLLGIYDDWAALFVVRCQSCGMDFDCAAGLATSHRLITYPGKPPFAFEERNDPMKVLPHVVGWGDAPWHHDASQCSGTTMTTMIVRLRQVWRREKSEWSKVELTAAMIDLACD